MKMIKSIQVGNKILSLRDNENNSENIFDVDSMSLIIGINGSGKTQFFNQVIRQFKSIRTKSFSYDCEINFLNSSYPNDEAQMLDWGVIYFSPIPFRTRLTSSRNFFDASPSFGRDLDVKSLYECKDILDYFDIYPRTYISYNVNQRALIKALIDEIYKLRPKRIQSILGEFSNFNEIVDINSSIAELSNESDDQDELSKLISRKNKVISDLVYQVIGYLKSEKDELDLLSFYITLSGLRKKLRLKKSAVIAIFTSFLIHKNSQSKTFEKERDIFYKEKERVSKFLSSFRKGLINDDSFDFPVGAYLAEGIIKDHKVSDYFQVKFNEMSSGQLALIHQFSILSDSIRRLNNNGFRKILLLIDEGDAYLHLEWQRNYIYKLNELLSKVKKGEGIDCLQVVIATHSPLLATDVPRNYICPMDKDEATSGFSSPMHLLFNESFGSKTIGEFASIKINETVNKIKEGRIGEMEETIIDYIDNDIIKRELLKRLRDKGLLK